jgi:hypothetical protein
LRGAEHAAAPSLGPGAVDVGEPAVEPADRLSAATGGEPQSGEPLQAGILEERVELALAGRESHEITDVVISEQNALSVSRPDRVAGWATGPAAPGFCPT